ncbi:MAG: alpha/beta hydrolase [Rubrivivax sp.]|nr:alpha/beta hydrolase [Rubrivivax sp.]
MSLIEGEQGRDHEVVWRGMTRAQIAAQYNPQIAVADPARYGRENREASAAARSRLAGTIDIRYGPGPRQLLDVFPAQGAALRRQGLAPVLLFVHGGGWRTLDKSVYSFVAPPWSDAGAVTVLPSYGLLPEVPLWRMVEEIREAIAWVVSHAKGFGGDPERIVVAGMSAGAQLGGMALAHEPSARVIRAAALASSVYDLDAHRWHGRHDDMALDDALVAKASPLRNPPLDAHLPMSLSIGADETPEMLRQTREYHAMLAARGHPVRLHVEPGRHHLNMGRVFAEPQSATFLALHRLLADTA